ncbi:MAG TPA: cation diffusion facilitator family transporter [Thermodesulfobacteriota bacterium]|nr:cation diffusion facilitator family transporter [Thermodesulfobacteriota bacterium]
MAKGTHSKEGIVLKRGSEKRVLISVLCLTVGFMLVEVGAGFYTGSLALLSDSAHMFMDVFSISLALFALWFSLKPPTSRKTFGFYRAEILAAFLNSLLLFGITVGIFIEAYNRLSGPKEVKSLEMVVVASIGLGINLLGAYVLSRIKSDNLNVRGAVLHVISDALGSLGAVIAGLVMLKTGWYYADPIISVLISALILRGAWSLFKESIHILLEGTPKGIDLKAVERAICSHRGVLGVHDLHAWSLTQGFEALSAHLVIEDINLSESLIREIKSHLRDRFRIDHVTLQVETGKCDSGNRGCYETKTHSLCG